MATNITAEWSNAKPNGEGGTTQKAAISLNDVVVNTTPTVTGGWNTATVTADVARSHYLTRATHGVPDGMYEKTVTGTFRKSSNV
jgi:hypothetical protein